MKNGFLKIALASPEIRVADPFYNAELCVSEAKAAAADGAKVLLFPELVISGATAADLFFQTSFCEKCRKALAYYKEATAELDLVSFVGFPFKCGSKLYDAVAAISHGDLLGISTRASDCGEGVRYFSTFGETEYLDLGGEDIPVGDDIVYAIDGTEALLFVEIGDDAKLARSPAMYAAEAAGLTEVALPDGTPATVASSIVKISKTSTGSYVFELKAAGYGILGGNKWHPASGEYIMIKLSVSAEGRIIAALTVSEGETDGIGDACASPDYYEKYSGKDEGTLSDVPQISGATITSDGYKNAVKNAFIVLELLTAQEEVTD